MQNNFSSRATADKVLGGRDFSGKTVIITGANAGIGFECSKAFSKVGAHVVLACRSESKAQKAINDIKIDVPNASLEFKQLDLADFKSVKSFADGLDLDKIDILICNAGIMKSEFQTTPQGHEMTAGVNHFGHFYLTKLLLPMLIKSKARVVVLSSESHRQTFSLNLKKWPQHKKDFGFNSSYAKSKLANVLFANELHKRYNKQGIVATSCHPGNMVTTNFSKDNILLDALFKVISPFTKTPAQGASTPVFCSSQSAELVGGNYFSGNKKVKASSLARNTKLAEELWEFSEAEIERLT